MLRTLFAAGLAMGLGLAQAATEVLPTAYTFDQSTDCGKYCYSDSGQKLIDGQYGKAGWDLDLGNGSAVEWVGWRGRPVVNIDFTFAGMVDIDTVAFGSTQNQLDDVVLPTLEVFAWTNGAWLSVATLATPEDVANNVGSSSTAPHGFLTLSGLGIVSDRIRVQARHSLDGPWTFVDEVNFYTSAVPEPATAGLVLAALPMALVARRWRKARRA